MQTNKGKSAYLWIILISSLLILSNGCASEEAKKAKHQQRAEDYLKKGELKKAVIELKNVIQLDPEDETAHYELAETYLKLRQITEAFQSYSRAVSVNPDNLQAQLKMGQI